MRRPAVLFLLGVLFLSLSTLAGWGQPDLVVQEIRLYPAEPEPDDQIWIAAIIANEGEGDASQSFDVRFKVDDLTVDRHRVTRLRAGRTAEVGTQWQAIEGEHQVTVEVDEPFGRVQESNERNNSLQLMVTVHRKAAVYSITDEVMRTIGEGLHTTGELFHFTLEDDVLAAIDEGIGQLERAQLILDNAGLKLGQMGESLPQPLSQEKVIAGGQAVGEVFQEMAASLKTTAAALRSFDLDSAVVTLREIGAELKKLSQLSFDGVQLGWLTEAGGYVEEAARVAGALQASLFGSDSSSSSNEGEGKTTGELIADFQTALGKAGDVIVTVGARIETLIAHRGIIFTDSERQSLRAYHSGETLFIQVYGARALMLEVYDPGGIVVVTRGAADDRLKWQGKGSSKSLLPAGEYFYRLWADRGAGQEETDLGRILIS